MTYLGCIAFVGAAAGGHGMAACVFPFFSIYGIERIKKCYHNIFKATDENYVQAFTSDDVKEFAARLVVEITLGAIVEGVRKDK